MSKRESWASSPARRSNMQANKSRDTEPELAVRRLIHAAGLRYRVNHRPLRDLRRTADIVFTRRKVAVFIDGCYWHGCPDHGGTPKVNADYWGPKIFRNRERDRETNEELRAAGWLVLRFWEHDSPEEIAATVGAAVRA